MKKRLVAVTAMILSIAIVFPAAAYPGAYSIPTDNYTDVERRTELINKAEAEKYGQWIHDENGDRFRHADGTFAGLGWLQIGYLTYYFDDNGYVLKDTITPDGKRVDHFGAQINEWNQGTEAVLIKTDDYDPEFPLKGRLDEFGLGMTACYTSESNWFYDFSSPSLAYCGSEIAYGGDGSLEETIRNSNFYSYYNEHLYLYREIIAFLAGLPIDHLNWEYPIGSESLQKKHSYYRTKQGDLILQMADEVKTFLNSFDWRNASEREKALRAAEWVARGSYAYDQTNLVNTMPELSGIQRVDYNAAAGDAFGALIWRDSVCQGSSEAFNLLTRCMGMRSGCAGNGLHMWNIIWIDGRLYEYDSTLWHNNLVENSAFADKDSDITDKEAYGFYSIVLEDIR